MGMACLVGASVLTSMAAFGFEVTERQARTSAALWHCGLQKQLASSARLRMIGHNPRTARHSWFQQIKDDVLLAYE